MQGLGVLDLVVVLEFVAEGHVLAAGECRLNASATVKGAEAPAVQQCIARGHVDLEVWSISQSLHTAGMAGLNDEAEAGDRDGKGVQVHAMHGFQGIHGGFAGGGHIFQPESEEPPETAEHEVPGAAGGINHPHGLEPEFPQRRSESAVEDEGLNKIRCLKQRVGLAGGLGEVLIEISKEAGVHGLVVEVMLHRAGGGIYLAPEGDESLQRIRVGMERMQGVVRPEQLGERGILPQLAEVMQQVIPLGCPGMLHEVVGECILRQTQPLQRPGEDGIGDESIVLQKADEDRGQHPSDGGLRDLLLRPGDEGGSRAFGLERFVVFGLQGRSEVRLVFEPIMKVFFQSSDLLL